MSLSSGVRLGAYEIVTLLGAGGMGEVYRARDTRLGRDVALKILPVAFAADAERLARFQREAHTLAALNHPNIAHLHGFEESNEGGALVMELVEGEDLSQRIARGAIPIDEALPIARQMAEALEAAHEQGVVHRDLKPANIKVRPDGTVKVLDFGLARALEPPTALPNMSQSPTITTPAMTQTGMILGTAAYMSPEQARGSTVDRRADVWAFGVVLWEMLTGTRLFEGATVSDTLASVLKTEPDWKALPQTTPSSIRRLLRRCLEKDRKRRLDSAAAARLEIDEALIAPSPTEAQPKSVPRSARIAWIVAAAASLAALALPAARYLAEVPAARDALSFLIYPPENTQFAGPEGGGVGDAAQLAVSPDGKQIVFVAQSESGYQLWLRPMGAVTAHAIPSTQDGTYPFWSPDSRSVGFFARGKLKRVQISGGPPVELCDAIAGRGGSWNADNVIVFAPDAARQGISRVSADGGTPAPVSILDTEYGESSHRWPHFLPDGRHFLYTAVVGTCCPAEKPARVKIGAIDGSEPAVLFDVESSVAFASGHLLFNRLGTVVAQPFDPIARRLSGDGIRLAENVSSEGSRYASFSASKTGVLVYAPLDRPPTQLTWLDREGKTLGTVGELSRYRSPALSRDDREVAVEVVDASLRSDLWVLNAGGKRTQLTFDPGGSRSPVWARDGLSISFSATRQGGAQLRRRLVSGAGDEERLVYGQGGVVPTDWSPEGRLIAYTGGTGGSFDIWMLPLSGDRKPSAYLQTPANESNAAFSPDGRWVAYQSNVQMRGTTFMCGRFPRPATSNPGFQRTAAANSPSGATTARNYFSSRRTVRSWLWTLIPGSRSLPIRLGRCSGKARWLMSVAGRTMCRRTASGSW
jgi:eukaryotic-like serine/threonine-protein kinase